MKTRHLLPLAAIALPLAAAPPADAADPARTPAPSGEAAPMAAPSKGPGGGETAAPTTQDLRKEINDAILAVQRYSIAKRDEALERARAALADLDTALDARERQLREEWDRMSDRAREEANEATEQLQQRRRELSEWYGGLKHGSQRAWEEIKTGFARAYAELTKAWERTDTPGPPPGREPGEAGSPAEEAPSTPRQ